MAVRKDSISPTWVFLASLAALGTYFPVFNIGDITGTSNGGDSFLQFQPRNVWATLGSVSWQHGKHSLKFGGDWRVLDFNEGQNPSVTGTYGFTRAYTQGPNAVQSSTTSGFGLRRFFSAMRQPAASTQSIRSRLRDFTTPHTSRMTGRRQAS